MRPTRSVGTSESSRQPPHLIAQMAILIACRLLLNTGRRFVYPFAPEFSRALNVSLPAVTSLIAVNWATALLGVFFGPLADQWGYRRMMITGLLLLAVGMAAGGGGAVYGAVLTGLLLVGLGKSVFDPAVQAYVSERVPFRRRGLAIGFLEVAWAGSALVGIPLVGVIIAHGGWRAPFFALAALGAVGLMSLILVVTPDRQRPRDQLAGVAWMPAWRTIIRNRAAAGALLYSFFVQMANDNLFVVYGAWLEQAYGLGVVAIGFGTAVIGAAELAGEFMTAGLSDRIGLRRSLTAGLALVTLAYALLPFLARSLTWALIGLFVLFLAFEFTVVTGLSLATEIAPGARATMMSGFFAAAGIGRVIGALVGGPVWLMGGMPATATVSAGINVLALVFLTWGLKGWGGHRE